jgi:hypothetical protein
MGQPGPIEKMSDKKHSQHITETPDTSHIKNLDVTHETSDVNVGSIGKFVLGLLVLTIVTFIGLWGMFRMLAADEVSKETRRPPMALSDQERLPAEPRLQSAPGFAEGLEKTQPKHEGESTAPAEADPNRPKDVLWEIKALNAQWHDTLEHGPVDQSGRRYGMPIEKAKEEVLKQLPVRGQKAEGSKQ